MGLGGKHHQGPMQITSFTPDVFAFPSPVYPQPLPVSHASWSWEVPSESTPEGVPGSEIREQRETIA
jgi:hypothetical protein